MAGYPLSVLVNVSAEIANITVAELPTPDPRTSEDCLFLDVIVPESIFNAKHDPLTEKAAVLVLIHGGGFTTGDKAGSNLVGAGDPAGLFTQSQANNQTGVIYIAMNYRLGLFGWQSGPTFQQSGTANAGLYDQRLTLEWVQKNIHLFGGDPDRVTVIGESAGGGSILHQITAFGGSRGKAPFQQAILQSPGFLPVPETDKQEATFQRTLSTATSIFGTTIQSVDDLRNLSTTQLQTLNALLVITSSPYGTYTFGPTVDGVIAPALPGVLLSRGQFDSSLKIMVGHNSNEGLLFTNPHSTDYEAYLSLIFPNASNSTKNFILNDLYPRIFDGSRGYTDETGRTALSISEATFACNTRYLDLAFHNQTFSYFFAIPPGIHTQDVAYTYFNGDDSASNGPFPPVISDVAILFQRSLTSFVQTGVPFASGELDFPVYGEEATVWVMNTTGFSTMRDTAANSRCDYWQKALYY